MDTKLLKISDLVEINNSLITILAKYRSDSSKFGIIYRDPESLKLIQLFSNEFALAFKKLVADFEVGLTTGAIVGMARTRTPADKWFSDTIERSMHDKNSIHQGILRIINQEDGIPVFIQSTSTVGNVSPALAYLYRGNPVEIKKNLDRYKLIQKNILLKILEGKPSGPHPSPGATYCAGEGFKAESRYNAISRRLEGLTLPNDDPDAPFK